MAQPAHELSETDKAKSGGILPDWVPWVGSDDETSIRTETAEKQEEPGLLERAAEAAKGEARALVVNQLPGAGKLFTYDTTNGLALTRLGWIVAGGAVGAAVLMMGRR